MSIEASAAGGSTCSDGVKNGDEIAPDCGGTYCRPCLCTEGVYCPNYISRIYFAQPNCQGNVLGYSYQAVAECATNSDDTTWSGNADVGIGDRRALNYGSGIAAGSRSLKWGRIIGPKATRKRHSTLNYGSCTNHNPPHDAPNAYLVEVDDRCSGPS